MKYEWKYPVHKPNYLCNEKLKLRDMDLKELEEMRKLYDKLHDKIYKIHDNLDYKTNLHNEYYIDINALKNDFDDLINFAYELNKYKSSFIIKKGK